MSDTRSSPDTAAYEDTDDAEAVKVLAALRHCANSWESGARLVGNVRAGDISRVCTLAINALGGPARVELVETIGQLPPVPSPGRAKLVRALESRSDEGLPYLLAASEVVIVLEAMRGVAQPSPDDDQEYAETMRSVAQQLRAAPQGSQQPVAWRYQAIEGWGDIWRCTTIPITFEMPECWTVQPLYASPPSPVAGEALNWAVARWNAEVANRPLQNANRSALDITWRQVIRYFGGDDIALCGPDHHELVACASSVSSTDREGGK